MDCFVRRSLCPNATEHRTDRLGRATRCCPAVRCSWGGPKRLCGIVPLFSRHRNEKIISFIDFRPSLRPDTHEFSPRTSQPDTQFPEAMIAAASPPVTDIFALFAGLFILTGLVAGLKNVVERSGMKRPIVTITAAFLCSAVAATAAPPVTFDSPCECRDNHGEHRWAVKNDPSTPPTDASAIQAITPSDVFSWAGPVVHLTKVQKRTGIEKKWVASTGRVVAVKVETDGDLHIDVAGCDWRKRGYCCCVYRRSRNGVRSRYGI